jgi:hypothetical protein
MAERDFDSRGGGAEEGGGGGERWKGKRGGSRFVSVWREER